VDLEIAVVAVGLARQQTFELATRRLGPQPLECGFGLGDDAGFAFCFAELDQLDRLVDLALDPPVAADRLVEPGAFTQQPLRARGIVPQVLILGLRVQLGETAGRGLPVKDASSAAPTTS